MSAAAEGLPSLKSWVYSASPVYRSRTREGAALVHSQANPIPRARPPLPSPIRTPCSARIGRSLGKRAEALPICEKPHKAVPTSRTWGHRHPSLPTGVSQSRTRILPGHESAAMECTISSASMTHAKTRTRIWAGAVVLLIVVCGACLWWMFDPIDRCLDRGGRWDYETRQCDFGVGTQ